MRYNTKEKQIQAEEIEKYLFQSLSQDSTSKV